MYVCGCVSLVFWTLCYSKTNISVHCLPPQHVLSDGADKWYGRVSKGGLNSILTVDPSSCGSLVDIVNMSPQTTPIGIPPKFYEDFANRPPQKRHSISRDGGNAAIFSENMQKNIQ